MKRIFSSKTVNFIFASIAGLLLLVFLWTYTETGAPPTLEQQFIPINKNPDFYLLNTTSTQYDEQGLPSIALNSDSITHLPDNDTALIKNPAFTLYEEGQLTWTVDALSGIVNNKTNQVDLVQRVVVTSSDGRTTMTTPALTIFADDKIVVTDKPVTLLSPTGFTRSIGLKANLKEKNVHLLKQVRGQYNAISE